MFKSSLGVFIKTALPILVLLQPITGQTEPALTEAATPKKVAPEAEQQAGKEAVANKRASFSFPGWPQRNAKAQGMEIVPAPPPGPYMSSALSDFSVRGRKLSGPKLVRNENKTSVSRNTSNISRTDFSPDVPWPSNLRPPTRWVPENGYNYVKPQGQHNKRLYKQNVAPAYPGAYRRAPMMSAPIMKGPRRSVPGMNAAAPQSPPVYGNNMAASSRSARPEPARPWSAAQAPRAPYPAPVRR